MRIHNNVNNVSVVILGTNLTFLVDTKICLLCGSMRHPQPLLAWCLQEEKWALAVNNRGASLQSSDGCTCRRYCCRWGCCGHFSSPWAWERRKDNDMELQNSCEDITHALLPCFPTTASWPAFPHRCGPQAVAVAFAQGEDLISSSSDSLTSAGVSKLSISSPLSVSVSSDSLRAPKVHTCSAVLYCPPESAQLSLAAANQLLPAQLSTWPECPHPVKRHSWTDRGTAGRDEGARGWLMAQHR